MLSLKALEGMVDGREPELRIMLVVIPPGIVDVVLGIPATGMVIAVSSGMGVLVVVAAL